ncbi:MAG TPA: TIGR03086 family metal-binding protein [Mycobacteriales bacterium]|nr:TIGR03086 family metal-binding protein [Mycobacteriales bacterium]
MTVSPDRARKLYEDGVAHFTGLVHAIKAGDWRRPTPCTEWSVRDLVNHLTSEALWIPPLLSGATIADIGDEYDGDVLGPEPVRAWTGAAAAALAAVAAPDVADRTVHLSYGDTTATHYVFQLGTDLLIHGWDLARGIGADDSLDPDDVHLVRTETGDTDLASSGFFDPPVPVDDDADEQTRLLATFGRDRAADPGQR